MVGDILFADDCAFVDHNHVNMQNIFNAFSDACKPFGHTISISNSELLYQPIPDQYPPILPSVFANGKQLEMVDKFTYLGSVTSGNSTMDKEIENHIVKRQ